MYIRKLNRYYSNIINRTQSDTGYNTASQQSTVKNDIVKMTRCGTQHSKQTSFLQGFTTYEQMLVGWDNVVMTCYRLDGLVIGTQW